jgi:hypothetical protein
MNPYEPPKARVDPTQQVGELWRSGRLVRMDRTGELPDRCIVCNAGAGGNRLARKLYWSPLSWRLSAVATPFIAMGIGIATETWLLVALFWPLVIVMMIAHAFVRKRLSLEMGMCGRHQRWLTLARASSFVCVAGVVASITLWNVDDGLAAIVLLGSIGGMALVAVTQGIAGVQAISLSRVDQQHAWLAGTGKGFRAALPELPG